MIRVSRRTALRVGAALAAALSAAVGGPAQERGPVVSPFAPLGLPRMSELATQVVAGTVERMEGTWNHDRSRIQTRITLRVERVLAGQAGERLVFRIPGGTVGETTVLVSEMPRFQMGEEVLVFLRGSRGRLPSVVGGAEGKLPLTRDSDGTLALLFPVRAAASARDPEPVRRLDDLERFVRGVRR